MPVCEVAPLIHPIYSEARRYFPAVSDLLQQELQVLRERNILRMEEIYGESFLTKKKTNNVPEIFDEEIPRL